VTVLESGATRCEIRVQLPRTVLESSTGALVVFLKPNLRCQGKLYLLCQTRSADMDVNGQCEAAFREGTA
jgi:hypothetical protein